MTEDKVLRILREVRAHIKDSHFVYASGKHGAEYINKDAVYPYTTEIDRLCREIANNFATVDTVIGPEIGGVILAQYVAMHLTRIDRLPAFAVYAEKERLPIPDPEDKGRRCFVETGNFVIKRGFKERINDQRVLIVEDVLTTGTTVKKVVEVVRAAGGIVIGVGALCNRGGVQSHDIGDVPKLLSLVNITLDAWDEKDCPRCKEGVPINTEFGKGKEFLARKKM